MTEVWTIDDKELAGEAMPLCPFCDQPMFHGEDVVIVKHDPMSRHDRTLGLAHKSCVEEAYEASRGEDDDDEDEEDEA